jgi:hypothetical protein
MHLEVKNDAKDKSWKADIKLIHNTFSNKNGAASLHVNVRSYD